MFFFFLKKIVALHAPWCRQLESPEGISPHLCAGNIKCNSYVVETLLAAAQYTVSHVGHEASPSMCLLLGTSKAARKRMTACRNESAGCVRAVKLDVRDLGGHLDVTQRALAGTLSEKVKRSHLPCHCGRSPSMGFQRMLWNGVLPIFPRWSPWM